MKPLPRIVCAAMLMDDGLIVSGVRHYSPDMRATMRRIYGSGWRLPFCKKWIRKPYHLRVKEQGFIDSSGAFLGRSAAWERAEKTGQILRNTGYSARTLFSENLY